MIESLQKEETLLMFSGKEVDFTRSLLDKQHKNNPLERWKKSLKHLDKLLKHLDKALELLGKTLETPLAIR